MMEAHTQEAIQYMDGFPDAKITAVAKDFGVSRWSLRRRLEGVGPKKGSKKGNTKLTKAEEGAVCAYIERLDRINLAVQPSFVQEAANYILKARAPKGQEPETVGLNWTSRFIKRHGFFKKNRKILEKGRQEAEDPEHVATYFEKLQQVIREYGIAPEDIWNMDETGFRIGVGSNQLIVTKRKRAHYLGLLENRESVTAVEAICADGRYIPAFLIPSGQVHLAPWYHQALDDRTAIFPTPTGYSNDEVSMAWIQHFNKYSTSVGVWRLLLMDRYGSHHTKEFIEFCNDNCIVPFGLPPGLTHLLQPLDLVVFQPLKHYHRKAIEVMVRDGVANITKLEFFGCIEEVRRQAFKVTTIKSAFAKAGIHPFNPQPILDEVNQRVAQRTPSPQPGNYLSSSPFSTPLTHRQIYKAAINIEKKLEESLGIQEDLAKDIRAFLKGAQHNTAEMIQAKRDLGRTQYAEKLQKERKSLRRLHLQSGGVLTVEDGRNMVKEREKEELAKARRLIERTEKRAAAAAKKAQTAAKKAQREAHRIGNQTSN